MIFFLFGLMFFGLFGGLWIWLMLGVRKTGQREFFGRHAIQLSIVCFSYALVIGSAGLGSIFAALMPLFLPLLALKKVFIFSQFIIILLPYAIAAFVVVFVLCYKIEPLRDWGLSVAGVVSLLVVVAVGEMFSKNAMCHSALEAGATKIKRNTLYWSFQNTPREFQFEIHGTAMVNEKRYGWSYREMDWYEIPPNAWGEVETQGFQDCSVR